MERYAQDDGSSHTLGPETTPGPAPLPDQARLAAPRATVGPTWRPGGEARRVSWEQRSGPPCGATGRVLGEAFWAAVKQKKVGCRVWGPTLERSGFLCSPLKLTF